MINCKKNGYQEIFNENESQVLFFDQDFIYIYGYRKSILKKWIFYAVNIVLCGLPMLLLEWYPQLIHFKCIKSCLKSADCVLVTDSYDISSVHSINTENILLSQMSTYFQKSLFSVLKIHNCFRYFTHKDIKYVWSEEHMQFYQLKGWDGGVKCIKDLVENSSGYTPEEQELLLKIYGKNEIKVPIPSFWEILIKEVTRPFYLFQIFSIILWVVNDYLSYALCVIFLTNCSVFFTLYSIKKQRNSLQDLACKSAIDKVLIVRNGGKVEEIHPSFLVPGDVIQIPPNGCLMTCDAVVLHGHCIVNENTLTGESIPVTKTPPVATKDMFNSVISKRHVLFCGTNVLQTRYYGKGMVTAVVINTGMSTVKGELVRTLLHPKPLGFKFQEDSIKFVFCLFFIATCGIFYFCYISFRTKIPVKTLVLDSLDLITIVVPPALPAALSAGIAYSRSRLLLKGIFCVSPPKINVFGKLKLMCFDKTGTLTEEGLDLWGILPCTNAKFEKFIENPLLLNPKHHLVVALATCHSLTKIEGKLCGNPLDLSMFNSLNWELNEPGQDTCRYDLLSPTIVKPKNLSDCFESHTVSDCQINLNDVLPYEIGIVREFSFTSATRCMSVITRLLGADHMNLYCKGAPERIGELCSPHSLPENFSSQLQVYASMGFRVIGVAFKEFDHKFTWRKSQRVRRQEVEHHLTFLGFIVMQNKLKQVSTGVMNDLRMANIRCVMITGDNLLTALSVSRECLMILPGDVVIEVKVLRPPGSVPTLNFEPLEPINCKNQELTKFSLGEFILNVEPSRCHYAMDGKTWELLRTYFSDLIPKIIVKGTIFARMLPEQKTQLVESFQDLDYIVGMCGDGANDYGAMKAAHVGVSLSETESSVVAPFTSKVQDVSCIVNLVREGRCALISTFVIFKYMTIYSLIQFISVLIVYEKGVSFGNTEFLFVDLIVTSLLAIVIGRTGPSNVLVETRPIARLISFGNLFPLMLQTAVLFTIQISALEFLRQQKWFGPVAPGPEAVTLCWENTVVYCTSLFQYIILALVYSKGNPYRQPFYKNFFLMMVIVAMTTFSILLCVWPFRSLAEFFELMPVEKDSYSQSIFRFELLIFPILNLIFSLLIEVLVGNQKRLKSLTHFITRKKEFKNRYKRILFNPDCYKL